MIWNKFRSNTLGGLLLHLLLAGGIIVILAIVYFYAYLPNTTNHGETITVPNIEGKPMDEVVVFLARHDLRYEVSDSSYSAEYPPLTVLKQYPHPGAKVKENRKIFLSVNRINPPTVPVPDLIDASVINADALLRSNELKRGHIELVPGPFNIVKSMKYNGVLIQPETRVPKGSVIDLVVMDGGSNKVDVPNVFDLSVEDAKFLIFGSNLSLGHIELVGDTIGTGGVVIKVKPGVGTIVRVGDVVDLWVGKPGTTPPDDDDEDNDNEENP
ncbi:MAG: PASTA domain-containing protein [Cyclobacteriaceae bacterium]|nr:PASTA domain-containing protein [Cyclobacteriaceae bacterium]